MNDPSTMAVLYTVMALCCLSTGAITYYTLVVMPRHINRRIRQTVQAFGTAIELRFPSHRGITERVVTLSLLVGRKLGLSIDDLRRLEMAAQLRDIGLCAVPFELINGKPGREWTQSEWSTYYRHVDVSGAMLELVPSLKHLATIVRYHHTPFTSTHDQFCPSGTSLPIESRILHVVTSYVAWAREEGSLLACDRVKRGAGADFDPTVVKALMQVLTSNRVESARAYAPA